MLTRCLKVPFTTLPAVIVDLRDVVVLELVPVLACSVIVFDASALSPES